MTSQETIEALRDLPRQVEELVRGLDEEALRWRPRPNEWSIKEVCAHLRDAIEIDGSRIQHMLTEDNPFLPGYDQEERARRENYLEQNMGQILLGLRAYAGGVAYLLEGMTEADWSRTGQHEEAGRQTVQQRAALLAQHAPEHLAQLRALRAAVPAQHL